MRGHTLFWGTSLFVVELLVAVACSSDAPRTKGVGRPAETMATVPKPPQKSTAPDPGLYPQKDVCARFSVTQGESPVAWSWCVDSVTVAEDGALTFAASWILAGTPAREIRIKPDTGSHRVYIVDDQGRRHELHDATGTAKVGGRCVRTAIGSRPCSSSTCRSRAPPILPSTTTRTVS